MLSNAKVLFAAKDAVQLTAYRVFIRVNASKLTKIKLAMCAIAKLDTWEKIASLNLNSCAMLVSINLYEIKNFRRILNRQF